MKRTPSPTITERLFARTAPWQRERWPLRWPLRGSVRGPLSALGFASLLATTSVHAMGWPDAQQRVERDLASSNLEVRRVAASQLRSLGVKRASPLVLKALDDGDPLVRTAAAKAATALGMREALPLVLPWFGDRDASLKLAACELVAKVPSPEGTAALARALGDADSAVRAAAADALQSHDAALAVPPLLTRLDDASSTVRLAAIRSLGALGDRRAVLPLLGKVQDTSPEIRQAVVRTLRDLGDRQSVPALTLLLRDPSLEVRLEAIAALGHLRTASAVGPLATLLRDRQGAVRLAAVSALGTIATPEALRVLIAHLESHDEAQGELERTPTRDALALVGPTALPELRRGLQATTSAARAKGIAWVLGALHAKGQSAEIIEALRRGALTPRATLHALETTGTEQELPVVLEYLQDTSPLVRDAARRATKAILANVVADGRAVEPLLDALQTAGTPTEERAELLALLGQTRTPRACAPLLAPLTSGPKALRLAALDALALMDADCPAEHQVLPLLDDESLEIRTKAARTLGTIGTAVTVDRVLPLLAKDHSQSLSTTLPALEGITSRIPLDEATNALAKNLDLRSPAQWDGIFQALARSVSPVALPWLQQFAASPHGAMRRAAAAGLGAQKAGPVTQRLLEGLARDKDLPVRSEALWSLGLAGGESSVKILVENAQSPATEMAINATGALGRLAVRLQAQDVAQRELCPLIKAPHSYVRVNALVGLSLSRVRCGRGDVERDLVAHDPSPAVRRQAALLLQNTGLGADDSKTLDRCSRTESRPEVAEVCQGGPPLGTDEAPSQRKSATVFVYGPKGPLPEVHAPYTLRLGNGLLRVGHTDRRGAVFEAETPPGPLTLESPWALVP